MILRKIGIVGLVVVSLIALTFMLKKEVQIEEEITIAQPKEKVFEFLKYIKNHQQFGEWDKIDPEQERYYEGEDGTVGFLYGWKSDHEKVGHGELEISKITEDERLDFDLRFTKPFEANDTGYFSTESDKEQNTVVKWGYVGQLPYFILWFTPTEEEIKTGFQKGLIDLKKILEKENI